MKLIIMIKNAIKKYKLALIVFAITSIINQTIGLTQVSSMNTKYVATDEIFPNPERGFYFAVDPLEGQALSALQLSELQQARSQNMTLVRRIYLLEDFRDKPISQFFLDIMSNDLETSRKAGVKLIIRFVYSWEDGGYDTTKERIISHIEQLQPIFKDNYDVIAYQEVGFIGYWGQWLNSSNNLVDNATSGVNNASREIFSKLLSAFPTQRMLALTNPKQKKQIVNSEKPLTASEAFTGTPKSRIGSFNDAFLYGASNGGYYNDNNIEGDKNYLNNDHLYVVQGGEVMGEDEESREFTNCSQALRDFERMRWSTINSFATGEGDGVGVIKKWKSQGCYQEIERRLGYRFRLIDSTIPKELKPGGTFSMKLGIANDGWASPYNPRGAEIILRHGETGKKYRLPIKEDPRFWMPTQTKEIDIVGGIPTNITPGKYQVLLNLPDPTPNLNYRPEYSIRIANQNVWEPWSGYNSLLSSFTVDSSIQDENYSGKDFFQPY